MRPGTTGAARSPTPPGGAPPTWRSIPRCRRRRLRGLLPDHGRPPPHGLHRRRPRRDRPRRGRDDRDSQQVHEADETLPVALDAAALLRADGYRVVLSTVRATTVIKPGPGDRHPDRGAPTLQGEHETWPPATPAPTWPGPQSCSASTSTPAHRRQTPAASPPTTPIGPSRPRARSGRPPPDRRPGQLDAQGGRSPTTGWSQTPHSAGRRRQQQPPTTTTSCCSVRRRRGGPGTEPDARRPHRAPLSHRPLRGLDRRLPRRPAGHHPGHGPGGGGVPGSLRAYPRARDYQAVGSSRAGQSSAGGASCLTWSRTSEVGLPFENQRS